MTPLSVNMTESETEAIWDNFHSSIFAFIRKRVESEEVAEDILQDVFLKIHRTLPTLKDGKKIQSWVFQITRNAIIDHYRVRRTMVALPDRSASQARAGRGCI